MMQNNKLLRTIGLLIMAFIALSSFAACETTRPKPMTPGEIHAVEGRLREVSRGLQIRDTDGLRLYTSKDITLIGTDVEVNPNRRRTTIRRRTTLNIFSLSKSTPGRHVLENTEDFDRKGPFIVNFDSRYPNLTFVQNRGDGENDRFYLNWVNVNDLKEIESSFIDQATGIRVITYRGVIYLVETGTGWLIDREYKRRIIRFGVDAHGKNLLFRVEYDGKEEPYLLYRFDDKVIPKPHTMRGVR